MLGPRYLRAFERELARSDAIRGSVAALGFTFSRDDPAFPGNTATRYPFELLSRGTRQQCENVFRGTIDGIDLVGFDLSYIEEADVDDARPASRDPNEQGPRRVTCLIGDLGASFSHLVISPVGAIGTAVDAATWASWGIRNRAIQFESRDFDEQFRVHSEDPRFASAVVDPQMMSWLLAHGGEWQWELQREFVLCTRGLVAPREVVAMIRALVAFARHIPRLALSY